VLPNRTYGPFDVFNPRNIWWMVVLIVGINLGGYIAYKFLGRRAGITLGGVLGGLISGTATTVSYAKRAAAAPGAPEWIPGQSYSGEQRAEVGLIISKLHDER
jgi:uncharacterized membrane protein (DUF4010 family)